MAPAEQAERARLVAAVKRAVNRRDRGIIEIEAKAKVAFRSLDDGIQRAERALAAFDAAHKGEG